MSAEETIAGLAGRPYITFELAGETWIFVSPNVGDYERFQSKVADSSKSFSSEAKLLCYSCCKYPGRKELKALFDSYPALPTTVVTELQELAGANVEIEIKKG